MKRVPAERWIVLPDLKLLRLELFVTAGHITGGRLAFLARFCALNGDSFAWHKNSSTPKRPKAGLNLLLFLGRLFLWLVFLFDFDCACAINGAKLPEPALAKGPFPFQLGLRLDGKA